MATDVATTKPIEGEKAQRIVEAMRASVALRGVAGSTFDHVAREAGVSRGLLHYYFGTKERLLVEVARRDCDLRMALLEEQLAGAATVDDVLALLRVTLEGLVRDEPDIMVLLFELFTLSRRNEDVAAAFAELTERTRDHVAAIIEAKAAEGVLTLAAPAHAIADLVFAIADGLTLRMIAEPDRDWSDAVEAAAAAVRALLQ